MLNKDQKLILQSTLGDIKIELDFKHTPKTAANFLDYAKSGFYEGTIFHRIINDFMIQGGGFTKDMEQKVVREPIENEADIGKGDNNARGTLAMARTSNPHSATAQFFINVNDNKSLNFKSKDRNSWGYCVFGKVIEGMEIIDRIKNVKTSAKNGHGDVPIEAVIIEKITLIDEIYKRSVCKFAVLNLLIVLIGRDLS